jgi:PAS domain S-box-containing protein
VKRELNDLATANSDNVQWNLSQAEVEYLAFMNALRMAQGSARPDLNYVRERFDVFYSRINTLETGTLYAELRSIPEVSQSLKKIRTFLDFTVTYIDGDASVLHANLSRIVKNAQAQRAHVRNVALEAIRYFSALHDDRRKGVSQTLINIAVLTMVLVVMLLFTVLALARLNRINQYRAVQNAATNSRLAAVVETSLDAIIVVDCSGEVLDYNGAAQEIFGYARKDAVGAQMADLIIPDHLREAHDAGMLRYLEERKGRVVGKGRVRLDGKRKNGEIFPVELSIESAQGSRGEVFVSYLRDISKEVEAETELRKARDAAICGEKSKAQLLAVMSHEIRTPLNGMLGTMELLAQTELSGPQARYLRIMERSGDMLLGHVNDVLDISRLDAGQIELDQSVFDLHALIQELIEAQRVLAGHRGNRLRFDPAHAGRELVLGDPLRLRQVLLNLIGNANKFTHGGEVHVEIETLGHGPWVEIRISDTGIGIAEQDINQIFNDFTTVDSSYGRRTEGTGLGLGIARRIVEAMGGVIGAESEPGEGSMFWVRLPIAMPDFRQEHIAAPAMDVSAAVPAQEVAPKSILLVEDNEINRMVAHDFLVAEGHDVSEARDGVEALEITASRPFELIFMDISMPELDGTETTRQIRTGNGPCRDVPIVALTAHALQEDVERFLAAGVNDVLAKPITRRGLRRAVAGVLNPTRPSNERLLAGLEDQKLSDQEVLTEFRQEIGSEEFDRLLHKFLVEMEADLASLTSESGEEGAKTSHRLSGLSGMFGAKHLRHHLVELESLFKVNDIPRIDKCLQEVKDVSVKTRRELTRYSRSYKP